MDGTAVAVIGERPERSAAFNELAERGLTRAYRLASALLRDPVEAEDATHEAILRAWSRFPQLADRDRFTAWFDTILVNECRERLRRRGSGVRELRLPADYDTPDRPGVEPAEREALRSALATLSPDHRIAVVLRFYLGLSVEEIAERTRTRAGTVKSRLHHALRQLRAAYEAAQR